MIYYCNTIMTRTVFTLFWAVFEFLGQSLETWFDKYPKFLLETSWRQMIPITREPSLTILSSNRAVAPFLEKRQSRISRTVSAAQICVGLPIPILSENLKKYSATSTHIKLIITRHFP